MSNSPSAEPSITDWKSSPRLQSSLNISLYRLMEFSYFPRLPAELRWDIWWHVTPPPAARVFAFCVDKENMAEVEGVDPSKYPRILQPICFLSDFHKIDRFSDKIFEEEPGKFIKIKTATLLLNHEHKAFTTSHILRYPLNPEVDVLCVDNLIDCSIDWARIYERNSKLMDAITCIIKLTHWVEWDTAEIIIFSLQLRHVKVISEVQSDDIDNMDEIDETVFRHDLYDIRSRWKEIRRMWKKRSIYNPPGMRDLSKKRVQEILRNVQRCFTYCNEYGKILGDLESIYQ